MHFFDGAAVPRGGEEVRDPGGPCGMPKRGGNFHQRDQNEFSFEHAWVGYLELGSVDRFLAVEQDVQVNEPGSFGNGFAAAHARFDKTQGTEQIEGVEFGGALECDVEKPILVEIIEGLGFVDAGNAADVHADVGEMVERGAEIFLAFPDIGAEGDVDRIHRKRPTAGAGFPLA